MNQVSICVFVLFAILVFAYFCGCSIKCDCMKNGGTGAGAEHLYVEPNEVTTTDFHLEPGQIADDGSFSDDMYTYLDMDAF